MRFGQINLSKTAIDNNGQDMNPRTRHISILQQHNFKTKCNNSNALCLVRSTSYTLTHSTLHAIKYYLLYVNKEAEVERGQVKLASGRARF